MISTNQCETNVDRATEGVDLTELQLFGKIKDELTVSQDAEVILRGNRIVIGLVKTKKLFCVKVWFPKIDHEVKEMINQCVLWS